GSGLSALLPQPKNLAVKEPHRVLLPSAFLRKAAENSPEPKATKSQAPGKSKPSAKPPVPTTTTTTPSPSAIKAAAKSAALQVTKQITQEEEEEEEEEEEDSEEDVEPENYFSLPDANLLGTEPFAYPGREGSEDPPPGTESEPPQFQDAAANAPLEFKTGVGGSGAQSSWVPKGTEEYENQYGHQYGQLPAYGEPGATGAYYQDYYSSSYYPELEPAQAAPQEVTSDSSFLDDEAVSIFLLLTPSLLPPSFPLPSSSAVSSAWHGTASAPGLTSGVDFPFLSQKKGDQPTGQQRRKHQITYLIHQAKERELELKNTWSENKLSRRQTQAKYGF
ncbi:PRCC protein, partial [Tricholaema leucomelas]|nr:PRCC protein [Tricholaema leucomelas]